MPVVFFFKYLGDIISSDGTDVRAVEARLTDASKAFGALRKGLFSSNSVTNAAKCKAYEALILSILLFGCEAWCLTEVLMQRLRVFHVQSVRAMCRVPRKHTWEHHISSAAIARGTSCPGHVLVPWAHSPIWSRQIASAIFCSRQVAKKGRTAPSSSKAVAARRRSARPRNPTTP